MLQRHSEAEWDRVGTERGTVRLRVRHGEAQCAAELGQVAPRAINQAQTAAGTGTGTGAGAGEGAEAAALSALRCMCAFVILLVVLARTHIIKARERESEWQRSAKAEQGQPEMHVRRPTAFCGNTQ